MKSSLWAVGVASLLVGGVVAADIAESLLGASTGFRPSLWVGLLGMVTAAWWWMLRAFAPAEKNRR